MWTCPSGSWRLVRVLRLFCARRLPFVANGVRVFFCFSFLFSSPFWRSRLPFSASLAASLARSGHGCDVLWNTSVRFQKRESMARNLPFRQRATGSWFLFFFVSLQLFGRRRPWFGRCGVDGFFFGPPRCLLELDLNERSPSITVRNCSLPKKLRPVTGFPLGFTGFYKVLSKLIVFLLRST